MKCQCGPYVSLSTLSSHLKIFFICSNSLINFFQTFFNDKYTILSHDLEENSFNPLRDSWKDNSIIHVYFWLHNFLNKILIEFKKNFLLSPI